MTSRCCRVKLNSGGREEKRQLVSLGFFFNQDPCRFSQLKGLMFKDHPGICWLNAAALLTCPVCCPVTLLEEKLPNLRQKLEVEWYFAIYLDNRTSQHEQVYVGRHSFHLNSSTSVWDHRNVFSSTPWAAFVNPWTKILRGLAPVHTVWWSFRSVSISQLYSRLLFACTVKRQLSSWDNEGLNSHAYFS